MLKHLKLSHIGPAPVMELEFGSRLNVLTGDNGLGKTFLLDACWYCLTKRTWADGKPFIPGPNTRADETPRMDYTIIGDSGKEADSHAQFHFPTQSWRGKQGRPPKPGLVVYARIDGGFSVWDPARNYWLDNRDEETGGGGTTADQSTLPAFYQFSKSEVWNGLPENAAENIICNGLLRDVETWRLKGNGVFALLQKVLKELSVSETEALSIGEGVRVRVGDVRDIPTLLLPYGQVPVTQAAAGMRRVLALAYLLVWAWEEHKRAAMLMHEEPTRSLVLLFDEVEAHLHPKWQRVFLPAVLRVAQSLLLDDHAHSVQIIATTHAPLVLGSVEAQWKEEQDRLFDLDLENGTVSLKNVKFAKHGAAEHWLSSESFDLSSSYPLEAQKAIEQADILMRRHPNAASAPRGEIDAVHAELLRTLGGDDEYWPYWLPYYDSGKVAR